MKPSREAFLAAAKALTGVPYVWGGKAARGLDCSGLVSLALFAAGGTDVRATHNSDRLWEDLTPTTEPVAGDLAFYGAKGDPSHVVICLGGPLDPILGANGGDRSTTSPFHADQIGAQVKTKRSPKYRPDLLGYRSTARWFRD